MYYYSDFTGQQVQDIDSLSQPPNDVTYLDISWSNLCKKTGAELVQMMAAIPTSVISLDISGNGLGNKPAAELAQMMAAIPTSVTSLDISWNDLCKKTGAELVTIMKAIPHSVTSLNISWNNLGAKTLDDLTQLLQAIPKNVSIVDLALLTQQQSIALLLHQVQRVINQNGLDFSNIRVVPEIDESNLGEIIHSLENLHTPLADFTCALLLDGSITSYAEANTTSTEYHEKRLCDAIKFYNKAGKDSHFGKYAEFKLWEMKTVAKKYSTAQKMLAQFDVKNNFALSYDSFGIRPSITLPFFKSTPTFPIAVIEQSGNSNKSSHYTL